MTPEDRARRTLESAAFDGGEPGNPRQIAAVAHAIREAAAAEREGCAKEADAAAAEFARRSADAPGADARDDWDVMRIGAEAVADAIRERGKS